MWLLGEHSAPVATAFDPEAADFGYLFETHHKELFRLALLLTGGDRFLAEEAVSHAFVATLPRWRKGEVLDAVPYLRRAVANHVKGAFRRRGLERREATRRKPSDPPSSQGESAVDDREILWSALRLLPPKQRSELLSSATTWTYRSSRRLACCRYRLAPSSPRPLEDWPSYVKH